MSIDNGGELEIKFSEIESFIADLMEIKEQYSIKVDELENIYEEISSSNSWRDENIKTAYIESCFNYITVYKNFISAVESKIENLKNKVGNGQNIENSHRGDKK